MIKVWITRPRRKGRKQFCYRLRWQEVMLDEDGGPVFDVGGKLKLRTRQESTGAKDRTTAESIARKKFAELNGLPDAEEEPESPEERPVTLEELLDKDEEWLCNRQRARGTIYLSRLAMRHFMKVVGKSTAVADVGAAHIEEFIAARADKVGPVSINRECRCLRATFGRAARVFSFLERTPFTEITLIDVPERPIRALSDEEETKLLDACAADVELDLYVRLALDTGARAGELCNLLWEQLDLEECVGSIECSSSWRSKTKRNRFIVFTPDTAKRLEEWRRRRAECRFVFRNEDEPERAHYGRIRDRFDAAVKRSGVRRYTLHDLRRTVGTRLAAAGINQKVAAAFLGHANITTTARFYQAVDNDMLKQAVMKIRGNDKK